MIQVCDQIQKCRLVQSEAKPNRSECVKNKKTVRAELVEVRNGAEFSNILSPFDYDQDKLWLVQSFFQPTERSRSVGKMQAKTRWLRLRSADLFLVCIMFSFPRSAWECILMVIKYVGLRIALHQSTKFRLNLFIILTLLTLPAYATNISGHIKTGVTASSLNNNDIASIYGDNTPVDFITNLRLNLKTDVDNWQFNAAIESSSISGDTVENTRLTGLADPAYLLVNDNRRAMKLTKHLRDNNRSQNNVRLDRLNAKYQTDNWQVTFGRQVISWGNGLAFQPLDLFNPFSPTAIDTDYKVGDDMLYGQYLFESGADLQALTVFRRNVTTDKIDSDYFSHAAKLHFFKDEYEIDLMAARHYLDEVAGFGIVGPIGEALWRFNISIHNQETGGMATSAIANLDYSWTWSDTNYYGFIEFAHSDFGHKKLPQYSFQIDQQLSERIARGEVFNYGRDYLAAGLTIDLYPLVTNNWILISNLHDRSSIIQTTFNYDPSDNTFMQLGIALPAGNDNTEYGGIKVFGNQYYGPGKSLFFRAGWYF